MYTPKPSQSITGHVYHAPWIVCGRRWLVRQVVILLVLLWSHVRVHSHWRCVRSRGSVRISRISSQSQHLKESFPAADAFRIVIQRECGHVSENLTILIKFFHSQIRVLNSVSTSANVENMACTLNSTVIRWLWECVSTSCNNPSTKHMCNKASYNCTKESNNLLQYDREQESLLIVIRLPYFMV